METGLSLGGLYTPCSAASEFWGSLGMSWSGLGPKRRGSADAAVLCGAGSSPFPDTCMQTSCVSKAHVLRTLEIHHADQRNLAVWVHSSIISWELLILSAA